MPSHRSPGRSPRRPAILLTAALTAATLVGACGGPAAPAEVAVPGLTTRFENVTLAEGVDVIEPAALAPAIRAVEPADDALTLRLDPGASGVGDLAPGDVALLGGAGPRRIESVVNEGGDLVVRTSPAGLGEVIETGTIGWSYGFSWDEIETSAWAGAAPAGMELASAELTPQVRQELAIRGTELKFKGDVKGFEVELKMVPRSDKLEFEFSATKAKVKVQAKGWISEFVQETTVEYDHGEATLIETANKGLKGEAEIEWAAFQAEPESEDEDVTALEIPLELPIPFTVGPVPMTMRLKAAARIVPAFNGEGSSGGSFKLTYDAEHGFSSNGGAVTPAAKIVNFVADLGSKETVTASYMPAGFGVGFEFPRLELALGHPLAERAGFQTYAFLTLNQYANGMFTPGTTLTGDIPPCQRASLKVSAIAGYKLSVLGFGELSDNTLLWEKTTDKYKDGKPCTLTGG